MAKNVLAVFAHPDDESLLAGGTLAKKARGGYVVTVVVLSDGVGSRFNHKLSTQASRARERRTCHFIAACRTLRVEARRIELFPDQGADLVLQKDINDQIAVLVKRYKPVEVYSHSTADLNKDHRMVGEGALVATRGVCPVFAAEPEWAERGIRPFSPLHFEDISRTIDVKLKACGAYRDELRQYPHPRSLKSLEVRFLNHGRCEAFEVYR